MPKEILEERQSQTTPEATTTPTARASPQLPPRPTQKPSTTAPASATSNVTQEAPSSSPPMTSFWSNKPAVPPNKPSAAVPTTKPAYLNTSYTPKKINLNIQNDICTKCGKAVYAAELVKQKPTTFEGRSST